MAEIARCPFCEERITLGPPTLSVTGRSEQREWSCRCGTRGVVSRCLVEETSAAADPSARLPPLRLRRPR